jgi:hypothetical protein
VLDIALAIGEKLIFRDVEEEADRGLEAGRFSEKIEEGESEPELDEV